MKRIIVIYGLIAGGILAAVMVTTMPLYMNGTLNFDNGELTGYSTMVIALSLVFFGIKSYRDKHSKGIISFGKAFKVGILITLIAAIMYAMAWEVCYSQMSDEFTKQMTTRYFEKLKKNGASDAELEKAKVEWASFGEMYKNPVVRFGVTLMEVSPVGIIITLLSAGLLRKKEFLPEETVV